MILFYVHYSQQCCTYIVLYFWYFAHATGAFSFTVNSSVFMHLIIELMWESEGVLITGICIFSYKYTEEMLCRRIFSIFIYTFDQSRATEQVLYGWLSWDKFFVRLIVKRGLENKGINCMGFQIERNLHQKSSNNTASNQTSLFQPFHTTQNWK